MLRGGITCFNDMYFFPGAALEAALEAGMRVSLGMVVFDFPSAYGSDPDDYLAKGLALRDQWREHPLVSFCLAPHAPYTVSDATFAKIAKLAAEVDVPVHIHLHETEQEIERSLAEHGVRPLERLERLGLLGPGLIAVHAVHLTDGEIALLARHGASVAHCPSSNLKLASGFAPVARWRQPASTSPSAPTARPATTVSTCSRTCGSPRCSRRRWRATPKRSPRTLRCAPRRWAAPRPSGWKRASAPSSRARPLTLLQCVWPARNCRPATTPCRTSFMLLGARM